MKRPPEPLERVSTGVAALDRAMRGGLPTGSTTIFAGASGTGKTILALQLAFEAASRGLRCVYFTTLSEPPPRLLRYMQLYEFFDRALLESSIAIFDVGGTLRTGGVEAALAELVSHVEDAQPHIVVIDSFKAVHDLVDPALERGFVYQLSASMSGWGATTILVGEYDETEIRKLPEFAIADGIIHFRSLIDELTLVRELEIRKLRGSDFDTGTHFYDLGSQGLSFFPRLRGPADVGEVGTATDERTPSGVPGIDELMDGGFRVGSSTVVLGGTGTGKTICGLNFLVEGCRRGEPSLLLMLEESPAQIRGTGASLGWNLPQYERAGLLELSYTTPVELSPDRYLHRALDAIHRLGVRRVLLDSLTSLELGALSRRRFKELVYALVKHVRAAGATLLMTMELAESGALPRPAVSGISFAADTILHLSRHEHEGRLRRGVAVLKARGVRHSDELREVTIGEGGARLTPTVLFGAGGGCRGEGA